MTAVAPDLSREGAAYTAFQTRWRRSANPFQTKNAFVAATYDGVIVFALAMQAANRRPVRVHQLHDQGDHIRADAVVVHLRAGRRGAEGGQDHPVRGRRGPMIFNQYNTPT